VGPPGGRSPGLERQLGANPTRSAPSVTSAIRLTEPFRQPRGAEIEISVVMPCLNEADTIGTCVRKAIDTLRSNGIIGEVLVADNGSTDASVSIATQLGARVAGVHETGSRPA